MKILKNTAAENYFTLKDATEKNAVEFGKKHNLKILAGEIKNKRVYFAGIWREPMIGTIYKPSQ